MFYFNISSIKLDATFINSESNNFFHLKNNEIHFFIILILNKMFNKKKIVYLF